MEKEENGSILAKMSILFSVCSICGAIGFAATTGLGIPSWLSMVGVSLLGIALLIFIYWIGYSCLIEWVTGCIAFLMQIHHWNGFDYGAYTHVVYGGLTLSIFILGLDVFIREKNELNHCKDKDWWDFIPAQCGVLIMYFDVYFVGVKLGVIPEFCLLHQYFLACMFMAIFDILWALWYLSKARENLKEIKSYRKSKKYKMKV